MFGIIDCNNFFVSCERVVHPELRDVPVVVLSNNDGCIVARSNEAKAMGIKMGTPFFRVRYMVDEGKLHACSGNLALYTELSHQVMAVVRESVPQIEVYSIDECFMDLNGITQVEEFGRQLSAKVEKLTGIPVSVGIAPTKTLAKLASKFAKKYAGYKGCCLIDNEAKRIKALSLTSIADVWGIGRRMRVTLQQWNVKTALDFSLWSEVRVSNMFPLPMIYTYRELKGEACYKLEQPQPRKSVMASSTFKHSISDFEALHAHIANFCASCARRLRKENSAAGAVTVFINTDPYRLDLPQYKNAVTVALRVATSDVRELTAVATQALRTIYREHYAFKRAGVELLHLQKGYIETDLFDPIDRKRQEKLLKAIDSIQNTMGKDAIRVATQELDLRKEEK